MTLTDVPISDLEAVEAGLSDVHRDSLSSAELERLDKDSARLRALRKQLKENFSSEGFDSAKVRQTLDAILDKSSADSVVQIAKRNGFKLDEQAIKIQRQKYDPEGRDAKYARDAAAVRAKAGPRAKSTFAIAQQAALADKTFEPVPTAHTAPADVSLDRSSDGARSLAITRPIMGTSGNDSEGVSAASRQIVGILRDGVPVAGGQTVHPDKLLWDPVSASAACSAIAKVDFARGPAFARTAAASLAYFASLPSGSYFCR